MNPKGGSTARRSLKRVVSALLLFLVVEYLVLPQIAGARRAWHVLTRVNVGLIVAGVILEIASLAAYAGLTRALLPPERRPTFGTLFRIDLSTLAVSHVIPGGSAAGTGLGYRLLTDNGVDGPSAGFALATQGLGSAVVLNGLLWVGLLTSIPLHGFQPLTGAAALAGALLLLAFGALVVLLTRGEDRAATVLRKLATHVPFLDEDAVDRVVHELADRLATLAADRERWTWALAWAATNWLLDAASLWVFVAAFGFRIGVDGLLVAYGIAYVLAAIPVTPAGLGVVEAVLTTTLVGFGAPRAEAILAVVAYRLVNFWLPIPVGGGAYVSLRVSRRERPVDALERLVEQSEREADHVREWAARHGVRSRRDRGEEG